MVRRDTLLKARFHVLYAAPLRVMPARALRLITEAFCWLRRVGARRRRGSVVEVEGKGVLWGRRAVMSGSRGSLSWVIREVWIWGPGSRFGLMGNVEPMYSPVWKRYCARAPGFSKGVLMSLAPAGPVPVFIASGPLAKNWRILYAARD